MSNWRDNILKNFIPEVSKLTLVADPDGLITEEKLTMELRQRGFDLIEFSDPVEFRYVYELNYRNNWDHGKNTDLIVALRFANDELETLPYDLLQAGRKLFFSLGEIFPNLSYPVVEKLNRNLLDDLFIAQEKINPDRMGDNATKEFILRHVYRIAEDLITSDVELLRTLLRLHYDNDSLPEILSDWLIQQLKRQKTFQNWPLEEIVSDSKAFYDFLQERWPTFLSLFGGTENNSSKDSKHEVFRYKGPDVLPFENNDIRVYIDNLFVEGKMSPVEMPGLKVDKKSWVTCGLVSSDAAKRVERVSRLFKLVKEKMPTIESRYSDWSDFAMIWAEISSLIQNSSKDESKVQYKEIGDDLNITFGKWLELHFASLINLPPTIPVMVHQIPRMLARERELRKGKVALIVVDGLALSQWVTIRNFLKEQESGWLLRESAVFAWIPTITSVSRQSIFSGKAPLYFPSSIQTTNNEGNLWKQFWEETDLSAFDLIYQRGLGDGNPAVKMDQMIRPDKTKVIGLVIDKVDKIMHGMQLGAEGMHNQIKQWCRKGYLTTLIKYLMDRDYTVWLTSDHGNIESIGRGRPLEGVLAETKGERVRIYSTSELRNKIAKEFKFANLWKPVGLPPHYFPLIAGGRDSFTSENSITVSHGGISIEEVIVPLIKFEQGKL